MKKFLIAAAAAQKKLIGSFVDIKEAASLSIVSGAEVYKGGSISFEQYKRIITSVTEHTKEWRRFREDPNKIVLEKNFFLRYIDKASELYLFRPEDDEGKVFFWLSLKKFRSLQAIKPEVLCGVTRMLAIGCAIFGLLGLSGWFHSATLLPVAGVFAGIRIWLSLVFYPKRLKRAEREFSCSPKELLQFRPCSNLYKRENFDGSAFFLWTKLEGSLVLKFSESKYWESFYSKILPAMIVDASRLKASISWLWYYGKDVCTSGPVVTLNPGEIMEKSVFAIRLEKKDALTLIPVIETDSSYIFYTNYIEPEMDITDSSKLGHFIEYSPEMDESMFSPLF